MNEQLRPVEDETPEDDQARSLGNIAAGQLVLCDPVEDGWRYDNVIEFPAIKPNPPDLAA